jgi:hypothetical protein
MDNSTIPGMEPRKKGSKSGPDSSEEAAWGRAVMTYLAEAHKRCHRTMARMRREGRNENEIASTEEAMYVFLIDQALADCCGRTQAILHQEYFRGCLNEAGMSLSRSTLARRRKEAVAEFLRILGIHKK